MSDIQQAAKWMQEGKKVRRALWAPSYFIRSTRAGFFHDDQGVMLTWLMVEDLLADDWEIFEWIN
jgi:hypothetical protein